MLECLWWAVFFYGSGAHIREFPHCEDADSQNGDYEQDVKNFPHILRIRSFFSAAML